MNTPVPALIQQRVPSLTMGFTGPSNCLVSTSPLQSRKDVAPRVPKRKSSSEDLLSLSLSVGRSPLRSHKQCYRSTANDKFEGCCGNQSLGSQTTMTSLTDRLGCLSPITTSTSSSSLMMMTPTRRSTSSFPHLPIDDWDPKSDSPPTIPKRRPLNEATLSF